MTVNADLLSKLKTLLEAARGAREDCGWPRRAPAGSSGLRPLFEATDALDGVSLGAHGKKKVSAEELEQILAED